MQYERFRFKPTDDIIIAVAVSRDPKDTTSTHSGIIYRNEFGKLSAIHQGWHLRFCRSDFKDVFGLAVPSIDDVLQDQVAGLCRLIRDKRPGIPYAFRLDLNARFCARTGELKSLGEGVGLTCSHFTVIVFQSVGIQLVELQGWPIRPTDIAKQRVLLKRLRDDDEPPSEEFLRRAEAEIGRFPRISSEEVAGACLEPAVDGGIFATHAQCEPNGHAIMRMLDWFANLHAWIRRR